MSRVLRWCVVLGGNRAYTVGSRLVDILSAPSRDQQILKDQETVIDRTYRDGHRYNYDEKEGKSCLLVGVDAVL